MRLSVREHRRDLDGRTQEFHVQLHLKARTTLEEAIGQDRMTEPGRFRWVAAKVPVRMVLSIGDQMVVSAGSFLIAIVVGRFLGSEALGIFSLGVSLSVFLLGTQTALISTPWTIFRAKRSGQSKRNAKAGSFLVMSLGLSLLTTSGLLAASQFGQMIRPDAAILMLLPVLAITLPAFLLREFARRFDFANMSMGSALCWDSFAVICQVSVILWIASTGHLSPSIVFVSMGVVCFVTALGWMAVNYRQFEIAPARISLDAARSLRLGRWVLVEHLLWTATFYSLHWILYGTMTAKETGILAACASIAGLLSPLFQGIGNYLSPHIARSVAAGSRQATSRLIFSAAWQLAAFTTLFACVIFVVGDRLLDALYGGSEFVGHGFIAGLLAVRLGFLTVRVPLLHTLLAMEQPQLAAASSCLGLTVTMICAAVVGTSFGIAGVVASGILGVFADLVVISALVRRQFKSWSWQETSA